MTARALAAAGTFVLLVLQWLWHAWLLPPDRAPIWAVATAFSLPLLPAVVLFLRQRRSAAFWAAVAALGYFSHGAMEAWADPQATFPAMTQAALGAGVIVAASWEGLRARFGQRR